MHRRTSMTMPYWTFLPSSPSSPLVPVAFAARPLSAEVVMTAAAAATALTIAVTNPLRLVGIFSWSLIAVS
jgi:hypothetical protein